MTTPNPLVPLTLEGDVVIAEADVPAFLAGIVALTPLPEGKTVDQISSFQFTVTTSGIRVQVRFKN